MCNPLISYAKGSNPYTAGGCMPCSEVVVPIGMYMSPVDCSVFLHCVNVPSSNLLQYTGSGNRMGQCPWQCIAGYQQPQQGCVACNSKGFNTSIHAYTVGCTYACIPTLFYRLFMMEITYMDI